MEKTIPTKQKLIASLIAVIVVGGVASNFIGHKKPMLVVQKPASTSTNPVANKIADVKAKHDEMKADKAQANADESAERGIKGDGATNNALKGVDSPTTISIDNLAVKPDQADLMLYNAVVAGDLTTAKHLVEQGVKVSFTDNALCMYDFGPLAQLPTSATNMPTNTEEMQAFISSQMLNHRLSQKFLFVPSVCSKTFLYASVYHIVKQDQRETFYYYHNDDSINATHNPAISDTMKQKNEAAMDAEERKDQMFKYILSQTPAKDYTELPGIFLDPKIPFSIRSIALQKYLDNYGAPASDNVAKYQKLYTETLADMVSKDPSQTHLSNLNNEALNPFASELFVLIEELHDNLTSLGALHDAVKERIKYDNKLALKELPELSVADWDHDGVSYQENPNSALWQSDLNGKQGFKTLYELNGSIKLINMILNSDKFKINQQDANGNTVLDYAVINLNNVMTNRGLAVFVRYLLNKGADPTLLNKSGSTALEMMLQRETATNGNPSLVIPLEEVRKAFTDKNYK